jgi:hypothetical protein
MLVAGHHADFSKRHLRGVLQMPGNLHPRWVQQPPE